MKIEWSQFFKNDEIRGGVELLKNINAFGYEAYIVGGCVRDIVKGIMEGKVKADIHDVDISTNMPIAKLQEHFRTESNNGEAHGTILVFNDDMPFEVTQFRTDGNYSDGRHPDSIKFAKTFKEDCSRRDFTINAMGIDADGKVIDYNGGIDDLKNGILRTVGKAEERFSEDSLRIIRAMRFSARFNMAIADETMDALCKLSGTLDRVAKERISAELIKTAEYGSRAFARVVELLTRTGASDAIDARGLIDWKTATRLSRKRAESITKFDKDSYVAIAVLLYNCKDLGECIKQLRMTNNYLKIINYIYSSIPIVEKYDENVVGAIKAFGNDSYGRMLEIYYLLGGRKIADSVIMEYRSYFNEMTTDLHEINATIQEMGFKGAEFGKASKAVTEWFYREQIENDHKPTYGEIEDFVLKL